LNVLPFGKGSLFIIDTWTGEIIEVA